MKPITFVECLLLLVFWIGGLAACLIGGKVALGWVVEAFMWAVFVWAARRMFLEYREDLLKEHERTKAFQQWKYRRNRWI